MDFVSVNKPESFVFHNGILNEIIIEESDMLWNVSRLFTNDITIAEHLENYLFYDVSNSCTDENSSKSIRGVCLDIDTAKVKFTNCRIEFNCWSLIDFYEFVEYCNEYHPNFLDWKSEVSSDGVTITVSFLCNLGFKEDIISMTIFCTEFIVFWDSCDNRLWERIKREEKCLNVKSIFTK